MPDATATQSGASQGIDPSYLAILQTIKGQESGNYNEHSHPSPGPSGAYQVIDPTWDHYAGYSRAYLAPPAVQDRFVVDHVSGIIAKFGVEAIPLYWYTGNPTHAPTWDCQGGRGSECAQFNANGGLQPGTYQARWMNAYLKLTGSKLTIPNAPTGGAQQLGASQGAPDTISGGDGCLLKIPSVDLKLFSLGGWCIGGNIVRPVIGALSIVGGGALMILGLSWIVKGQSAQAGANAIARSIKSSVTPTAAERADERVRMQRGEALQYQEAQQQVRTAGATAREQVRTQEGVQRRQLFTLQKQQEVQARSAAQVEAQRAQRTEFARQKTGERINARIVRKQHYSIPTQSERKVRQVGVQDRELEKR